MWSSTTKRPRLTGLARGADRRQCRSGGLAKSRRRCLTGVSLIVISPIIPMTVPFVRAAQAAGHRGHQRDRAGVPLQPRGVCLHHGHERKDDLHRADRRDLQKRRTAYVRARQHRRTDHRTRAGDARGRRGRRRDRGAAAGRQRAFPRAGGGRMQHHGRPPRPLRHDGELYRRQVQDI